MKRNIRKAISIILCMLLVFTLIGCGTKDANANPASTSPSSTETSTPSPSTEASATPEKAEIQPEEGATLKLWMDNDAYNEQLIAAFNAKYPGVTLTAENVGTTDARGKMELDGPAGMGADVFVQPHDGVAISAQSGLILENDIFADFVKENFDKSSIGAVTYNNKIYAFPLTVKTIALFYNKDLVKEPVKTWDEMREFAKSYNNPKENKFALLFQAVEPYYAHGFLSGYGYKMFGPNADDKNQINWDTPEALEGMKFYSTLNEIYPVASQDATWDAMNSVFSAGQAPYVITGPWSIGDFTKAGVNFGVTELPLLPNGQHPVSFSTVDTVCVSSFTKYPNASLLLAKFMASDGLKIVYDTKHELPANINAQKADYIQNDANLSGVARQAAYSQPMPYIPEMANVWTPYKNAFVAVWDKLSDPETALKNATEEFKSSLVK